MTNYQPPQIGFSATTRKQLNYLGWPNHLIGASEGEIGLEYKKKVDQKATTDAADTKLAVWVFYICTATLVAVWAYGMFGGGV